jgi:hypothetical protein
MNLEQFKKLVRREFGGNLEHMTPANVREFLDEFQRERRRGGDHRFQLNETQTSYEAILRDFFRGVLELPPEEAVIPLWTLALDLAFADLREVIADQVAGLFGPDPDGD